MVPKFTGTKCSRLLKSVRLAKAALAPLALTQISLIKHNLTRHAPGPGRTPDRADLAYHLL